jgi:hypothetical protein
MAAAKQTTLLLLNIMLAVAAYALKGASIYRCRGLRPSVAQRSASPQLGWGGYLKLETAASSLSNVSKTVNSFVIMRRS